MNKQTKPTTLDIVRETIDELGYELDFERGWINRNDKYSDCDRITIIASKVRNALQSIGSDGVPPVATIIEAMELLEHNKQKEYATKCYDTIQYNATSTDTAEDLCRLISGENFHPIYPHIIRQWIYMVKNRLKSVPVRCPIFPIFYGKDGGIGKSTFIKRLYGVLPAHKCSLMKEGQKVVDSEKHTQMFIDNLVIHLDELAGMDKASIEKLKTVIDATYFTYVPLYTNTPKRGFGKASFIGSSNTAVKNVVISTDLNRKWVQVNFFVPPVTNAEAFIHQKIKDIETFNYVNLWQSVNENGDEPLSNGKVYEDYKAYVDVMCRSHTPTTDFIDELITSKAGEWIAKTELYNLYTEALRKDKEHKPQRRDLFNETCEKRGFVFKRKAHSGLYGYIIPGGLSAILQDEEEGISTNGVSL